MRRTVVPFLLLASAPLTAQDGLAPEPAMVPPASWRIPIHDAPADPALGDYGLWASGDDYKVSFHDGMVFYPLLGAEAPRNLPWRWTTESVRIGGRELLDRTADGPSPRTTAWRCTFPFGSVDEVYDVRADGVEQSFVLRARPAAQGDLVITGRVDGELTAGPAAEAHRELLFADGSGRPVVRYGAAWVFDAVGRRAPVATGTDGRSVTLRVDGAWLADAVWPVTVDPLVGRTSLITSNAAALDVDLAVAPPDASHSHPMMTVYSRQFSATDSDAQGYAWGFGYVHSWHVWSDVSASWSTPRPRCSYANGSWVVAFPRQTSTASALRMYFHGASGGGLNGGLFRFFTEPNGMQVLRPDVASVHGDRTAHETMVVYEAATGISTGTARVYGLLVDLQRVLGAPFSLGARRSGATDDQRRPAVGGGLRGNDGFVAAWQENDGSRGDDWDVVVNRFSPNGVRASSAGVEVGPAANSSVDAAAPLVEGAIDRFLVAFHTTNRTTRIRTVTCQRFDWPPGQAAPSVLSSRVTSSATLLQSTPLLLGLAADRQNHTHWALVVERGSQLDAVRVGGRGGVVERSSLVFSHGPEGGVGAIAEEDGRFAVVHGEDDHSLIGGFFEYGASGSTSYGAGCQSASSLSALSTPHLGNDLFRLRLQTGTPRTPAFLLASTAAAPGSIPVPGAFGCFLFVDASTLLVTIGSGTTDAQGGVYFPLPLPDIESSGFDLHVQSVYLAPGANQIGLLTSNAVELRIR